jgi:esterase/lipase superfamily enzyme
MTLPLPPDIAVLLEALARAPAESDYERLLESLRVALWQLRADQTAEIERLIDRIWATNLQPIAAREAVAEEIHALLTAPLVATTEAVRQMQHELTAPGDPDRPRLYQVWYGTNRRLLDRHQPNLGFANEGESDPSMVHYGTCEIAIPKSHRFGSLGSSFLRRWTTWTDDRVHLQSINALEVADFWRSIQHELANWDANERQVLVIIHGFNVDFREAALRTAQLGFDLNFPGITAFFSWPSRGQSRKYNVDEATIESCERPIAEFLVKLVEGVGAERVHIVAHSMGNRALLRAVRQIADEAQLRGRVRFGQVVLAAPDVDARLFRQLGDAYPRVSQRTTHYVSPRDRAVGLSRWLHGADRAGFTPPISLVAGIDTIEVPKLNWEFFGHNFFAGAEALLSDIYTLLRSNVPPGSRPRFRSDEVHFHGGLPYWRLGN